MLIYHYLSTLNYYFFHLSCYGHYFFSFSSLWPLLFLFILLWPLLFFHLARYDHYFFYLSSINNYFIIYPGSAINGKAILLLVMWSFLRHLPCIILHTPLHILYVSLNTTIANELGHHHISSLTAFTVSQLFGFWDLEYWQLVYTDYCLNLELHNHWYMLYVIIYLATD